MHISRGDIGGSVCVCVSPAKVRGEMERLEVWAAIT